MQIDHCTTIVIKIGSSLVADSHGKPRHDWMASLAADVAALRHQGKRIILVSSGAVALGRHLLAAEKTALLLQQKQAAAACGQPYLIRAWQEAFAPVLLPVAQLLLTLQDSENRRCYLNARNTLLTLLDAGIIPIVNENDTVATAEIRYGDNDRLAARVAQMAGADLLVLLSDVQGLYTANPATNPDAQFIPSVSAITPEVEAMAGPPLSGVGTGGMVTKIQAAKMATHSACHTVICNGHSMNPLTQLSDETRRTVFLASGDGLSAWQQWIIGSMAPIGNVTVDAGAANALQQGKSLLPAGVTTLQGRFSKGDAIGVYTENGQLLAKGLANYDDVDAQKILGKQSAQIASLLGYEGPTELIHRDNLALFLNN